MMWKIANRGDIFDFIEKDGTCKNKVLIISNQRRSMDNIVSILMLGTKNRGADVVTLEFGGESYYVHCGLVTYARRERLGELLGRIDDEDMAKIDSCMAFQLGLLDQSDYKKMYEDLLTKVMDRPEPEKKDVRCSIFGRK